MALRSGLSPRDRGGDKHQVFVLGQTVKRKHHQQDQQLFFLEDDESKPASSWLLPWCPVQEKRENWWWLGWAMNVGRSLKEAEPWK